MTQEDKNLLLKDLSARLPYGVICTDNKHGFSRVSQVDINYSWGIHKASDNVCRVYYCDFDEYGLLEECKPYLRPISSMTKKEKKELWTALEKDMSILESNFDAPIINEYEGKVYRGNPVHYELDFLISNHFDYLDLIPMGLALEAPEGMYKNE